MTKIVCDLVEPGKPILDQGEPAVRGFDQVEPAGDGVAVAVDADDLGAGRRQDGAGMAAGPEGAVHIDAARTDIEQRDCVRGEHGNVTGWSASDTRLPGVAARHHPRAPCGSSAALREPNCFLSARTFPV